MRLRKHMSIHMCAWLHLQVHMEGVWVDGCGVSEGSHLGLRPRVCLCVSLCVGVWCVGECVAGGSKVLADWMAWSLCIGGGKQVQNEV